jgi:ketosteroid isomerase-like protein
VTESANVELVRWIYSTFWRDDNYLDSERLLAAIDAEVVLDWSNSDAPDSGVYQGRAAMLAFRRLRDEAWEDRRVEVDELIDAPPDRVVVIGRMRGRGRASGVEVEARTAVVWTLRDGQATRVTLYKTRDEAVQAVGLKA